jgi:folate-binding protein YgfZ
MPPTDPLHPLLQQLGATFIPYGPADTNHPLEIADTFGAYEPEYAAIRKGAGFMHTPQRSLIEVTGSARLDFLHRMLTHSTRDLQPGAGRRAFLLSNTGRITADLLVLHTQPVTYLLAHRHHAPQLIATLNRYLLTEDVQLHDASDTYTLFALHGPAAAALLSHALDAETPTLSNLDNHTLTLAGQPTQLFRHDETGEPGLHLAVPNPLAADLYHRLLAHTGPDTPDHRLRNRCRPIGWSAFNTARIEAGTPIFHIDFGPDSLPHETGLLHQAVSFTKGCYLGQEIVARMQNLGHPKRLLVGLRLPDHRLPIAGAQVFEHPQPPPPTNHPTQPQPHPHATTPLAGSPIGAVTSSTISPMLGGIAIAFAMIKWGFHHPDTPVAVPAEGQLAPARVHPLRFI